MGTPQQDWAKEAIADIAALKDSFRSLETGMGAVKGELTNQITRVVDSIDHQGDKLNTIIQSQGEILKHSRDDIGRIDVDVQTLGRDVHGVKYTINCSLVILALGFIGQQAYLINWGPSSRNESKIGSVEENLKSFVAKTEKAFEKTDQQIQSLSDKIAKTNEQVIRLTVTVDGLRDTVSKVTARMETADAQEREKIIAAAIIITKPRLVDKGRNEWCMSITFISTITGSLTTFSAKVKGENDLEKAKEVAEYAKGQGGAQSLATVERLAGEAAPDYVLKEYSFTFRTVPPDAVQTINFIVLDIGAHGNVVPGRWSWHSLVQTLVDAKESMRFCQHLPNAPPPEPKDKRGVSSANP